MASPAPIPVDPELKAAQAVARGICRLFARNDIWCLSEMPLRSNRRADLMGIDAKGHLVIVEIKVSRADLLGDGKWTDYLDHCDRFYWGLAPHLDRACLEEPGFLPQRCGQRNRGGGTQDFGVIAIGHDQAAALRKAETERLARAALRRQLAMIDPNLSAWSD
jgi:hypothetical protein